MMYDQPKGGLLPTSASLTDHAYRLPWEQKAWPVLYSTMWIWEIFEERWLLAVQIPRTCIWRLYTAGGQRLDLRLRQDSETGPDCRFSHHTPIYAPRSTPE